MIILVGKSCSGKDTVVKELAKMGYNKIVTCTTRPPRPGEINGREYHFLDKMNFLTKINCGSFAEYRIYETVSGAWYYGSLLEDYSKPHSVIILTPDALDKVRNKINENVTVIYLEVSNREIKRRMLSRDVDRVESKRRYKADKKDFRHISKKVDYIVHNENRTAFETALICKELDEIKEKNNRERSEEGQDLLQ